MNRLTVVIPYNKDRGYLAKAIASVSSQTVPVDLIKQRGNKSCAENLCDALERVETEFYSVLAEDDWLDPQFAEKFLRKADAIYGDFDILYGNAYQYNETTGIKKLYRAAYHGHADLVKRNLIHGGSVVYRTESVRSVGGYDCELKTAEEYDLHMKMSKAGMKFVYVDFALYFYRIHGRNKSKVAKRVNQERKAYINELRNRYR